MLCFTFAIGFVFRGMVRLMSCSGGGQNVMAIMQREGETKANMSAVVCACYL